MLKNTKEHMNDHLTPRMQCKHCLYDMKTIKTCLFGGRFAIFVEKYLMMKLRKYNIRKDTKLQFLNAMCVVKNVQPTSTFIDT
jgi:hypothetical protein